MLFEVDKKLTRTDWESAEVLFQEMWEASERKGWHTDERGVKFLREALNKYQNAASLGWWTAADKLLSKFEKTHGVQAWEKLMLIVTEAAEAAETLRDATFDISKCYMVVDGVRMPYDDEARDANGNPYKPEGFGSEIADIVIRCGDLAKSVGVDIVREIHRKMRYNETRGMRHGGKLA